MDVEIPANTTATVYVPAANAGAVSENGKAVSTITDVKVAGTEDNYVVLQIGSGKYHFAVSK
jgi:alpha-L-rhamnosidase